MKSDYKIIVVSIIMATTFWLLDAIVDYVTFYNESFLSTLLFDRNEVIFRLLASSFFIGGGIFVARAISKQKRTEEELLKTQNYLQSIIETEPECIKLLARDGTLLMMNRAGLEMIEAGSLDQVKGRSVSELVCPEYRQEFKSLTDKCFEGSLGTMEFEIVGIKGRRLWLETHAVPLRDAKGEIFASLGVTRNITERKHAEEQLRAAIREKDVLLKEIHHRVKNNLQVVASMLQLQSAYIEDKEAKLFFEESQKRVETMSLIHEKLYGSQDLASIDFREYVHDLTDNLLALHAGESK